MTTVGWWRLLAMSLAALASVTRTAALLAAVRVAMRWCKAVVTVAEALS